MTTRAPTLTPRSINKWLGNTPDHEVVAYSQTCSECPLARTANHQGWASARIYGEESMVFSIVSRLVDPECVQVEKRHTTFTRRFIRAIDSGRFSTVAGKFVTAGEVRAVLRWIEGGAKEDNDTHAD